ncbi:hypothetical protein PMAYCL1PPCAC_28629 [Pristionchus mayeri]|uniref:CCHC-type domain-containing protein n=1 Tax=Pristionchus mayeri TaxID=1317129 RepID=A0AAN5DAH7_9BILA|nr:hypothetical protein PMAYCL1PPCAC_28629 [Pristionchus mayeri]
MSLDRPDLVDPESKQKFDELIDYMKDLVKRNLPDELTQSTVDPQFNEVAMKRVVEFGYRDTTHFCESFPEIFQVYYFGVQRELIISLHTTQPRVKPSWMRDPTAAPFPNGVSHQPQPSVVDPTLAPLPPICVPPCNCFISPEGRNSYEYKPCTNCNMMGHYSPECPSSPRGS